MPLSDHEQHELDEIEHALSLDSPQLASSLRTAQPQHWWSSRGGRLVADLGLLLTALALLILGVHAESGAGTVLGVVGYVLLVLSLYAALAVLRQWRHSR